MSAQIAVAKSPFDDTSASSTARRFGMVLFLISLGVLFAATVLAFAVVRVQLDRDGLWPDDLPALPAALWASTVLLLASGVTMHAALRSARAGDAARLRRRLHATTALGVAFLVVQVGCWWLWHRSVAGYDESSDGFRLALTAFYVLSGIHALHVVGGIAGLLFTSSRAVLGRYTAEHHTGVRACAMYWHFLDVVWIVLFALLLVGG
jgi:cytochrome c oxidase subunit 3